MFSARSNQYFVDSREVAKAFRKAYELMTDPTKKIYKIGTALRYACGQDIPVYNFANKLIHDRIQPHNTPQTWLEFHGVHPINFLGLEGMRGYRTWKTLWLEKLAQEFEAYEPYRIEYSYP